LLNNGQSGAGGSNTIGTDNQREPLNLDSLLSPDEVVLAGLLSVSAGVHFVNDGAAGNQSSTAASSWCLGETSGRPGPHQQTGVLVGSTGAQLGIPGQLDWEYMVLDERNTWGDGYSAMSAGEWNSLGRNYGQHPRYGLHKIYAKFFSIADLPDYSTASKEFDLRSGNYAAICTGNSASGERLLNLQVYRKRIEAIVHPLLLDANRRAEQMGKTAYVHVVPCGLTQAGPQRWHGVDSKNWSLSPGAEDVMASEYVRVLLDALRELDIPYVSDVDVATSLVEASHRAVDAGHDAPRFAASGCHRSGANDVAVHCTGRAPAAVLPPAHRLKLLVVNFECTGGVSIGNEYWAGVLSGSSEANAASSSTLCDVANAELNPCFGDDTFLFFGHGKMNEARLDCAGQCCPPKWRMDQPNTGLFGHPQSHQARDEL